MIRWGKKVPNRTGGPQQRPGIPLSVIALFACTFAAGLALVTALRTRNDLLLSLAVLSLAGSLLAMLLEGARDKLASTLRRELHGVRARLAVLEELASHADPAPEAVPAPAGAGLEAEGREDAIDLYLEPVIEITSGQTLHYRASLNMRLPGGMRFDMASVQRGAERAGVGPLVEFITLKRSLEVASHMHARGRRGSVFCHVSAASFASPDFIARAVRELEREQGLASCIILEITESTMAVLSDEGMNGLAQLADHGVNFCLAGARGRGAGPAILAGLGIRHLMIDADIIISGEATDYLAACRRAGLIIIAAGVQTPEQADGVRGEADFAFGPKFATPRMVRPKLKAA